MKKSGAVVCLLIISVLTISLMISSSLISASIFSDFFGKITGHATATTCTWGGVSKSLGTYVYDSGNNVCKKCTANGWAVTTEVTTASNCTLPPTCTSFTYSDWSSCSSSGTQTRTVTAYSPSGCNGGNPTTSQSCTYVPPTTNATCTDSDGGLNYYVQGETSGYYTWEGRADTGSDMCGNLYPSGYFDDAETGNTVAELFCLDSTNVNYTFYQCPNGCANGACVNSTNPPQPTCTDSDGGLNYYVKGFLNTSVSPGTNFEDYCLNNTVLIERHCFGDNSNNFTIQFACPNGCLNGACVNSTQSICTDSDNGKDYYTRGTSKVEGTSVIEICVGEDGKPTTGEAGTKVIETWCNNNNNTIQEEVHNCQYSCVNGACKRPEGCSSGFDFVLNEGETKAISVDSKVYEIKVASISMDSSSQGDYVKLIIDGVYTQNLYKGRLNYMGDSIIEVGDITLQNYVGGIRNVKLIVHSDCANQSHPAQICQSLIDSVKNPASTDERRLSYNATYTGYEWVNGQPENYTDYSASWYWNAPESKQNQINYYYASYDISVFDNKNVDLKEAASWNQNDPACKANSYFDNSNKESFYYICNWNAFSNQQDLNNNYQGNNRQVFWYNGNVIVRIYLYYGTQLTDEQVSKLSQQKVNELINNLQDNQYKYVDWSNFDIQSPASEELYNTINSCGSDLAFNWSTDQKSWSCKTEPVVCPEHGFQTRTCRAYNPQTKEDDIQVSQIDCSPGICSGCLTPKWLGGIDNKCIPYGFRLNMESGRKEKIYESDIVKNIITQLNVSANFTINRDGTASIYINKDIDLSSEGIGSMNIYIDGKIYEGKAGESLIVYSGVHQIDATYYDLNGNKIQSDGAQIEIGKIFYSEDASQRYLELIFRENYPAYCDIDGRIKQQKSKDESTGNLAECQNNYECDSNTCAYGACVDLKGITARANAFQSVFVKVICKLSSIFGQEDYNQCIYKYLGPTPSTPSSDTGSSSA